MRSFLAGFAVLLSFFTGVAGLAGLVAHHTVLDPGRAGEVVEKTLQDRELRADVLNRAVPGYGALPAAARSRVDALAETSAARRAVRSLRLQTDGTVSLLPLQEQLAQALRDNGLGVLAKAVTARQGQVTVPARYMNRYNDARRESWQLAVLGGIASLVLVVLALVVSPRRSRTLRSVGVTAILVAAVVAAGFWVLPSFVRAYDSDPAYQAVASAVAGQRPDMALLVVPVAVVGLLLAMVSLIFGSRSNR